MKKKEVYKSKLFNTNSKQEEIVPIILTEEKNEIKDFIHEYNESNLQKTIDSSTKLFSIDQKDIVFQINQNNQNRNLETNIKANIIQLGQTSITLSNLTSEYLNIKSKTTKRSYYVVDPTYCILPPNSTKKININYYGKVGEKISNIGHRFLFEGFIILPEEKDQDSKDLFSKYINENNKSVKSYEIKVNVKFIENIGNEININNNNIHNSNNILNDNKEMISIDTNINKNLELSKSNMKKQNEIKSEDNKAKQFSVIFSSIDQNILFSTICFDPDDKFSKLEEQLFDDYPELRNKNIYFLANGEIVDRSASVKQNKIVKNTIILINYG